MIYKSFQVAIGPVTEHTLYSYRSGSDVHFYIYPLACHFYCFFVLSHHFVVPPIQFAGRILAFHVQFLCKETGGPQLFQIMSMALRITVGINESGRDSRRFLVQES